MISLREHVHKTNHMEGGREEGGREEGGRKEGGRREEGGGKEEKGKGGKVGWGPSVEPLLSFSIRFMTFA